MVGIKPYDFLFLPNSITFTVWLMCSKSFKFNNIRNNIICIRLLF